MPGDFGRVLGVRGFGGWKREIRCQETQVQVKIGHAAFATLYNPYITTL